MQRLGVCPPEHACLGRAHLYVVLAVASKIRVPQEVPLLEEAVPCVVVARCRLGHVADAQAALLTVRGLDVVTGCISLVKLPLC